MEDSFENEADEIQANRPKINHSQGVVGKVEWESLGGHDYTGIFEQGSTDALIRMSESNFLIPEAGGLAPSLAIKFLRDGRRSTNLLANVGFESTDSFNFMATNFRHRIDLHENHCAAETIERKFANVHLSPQSLGISEIARFTTVGSFTADPIFPFELWLEPSAEVSNLWPDERQYDSEGNEIKFYE